MTVGDWATTAAVLVALLVLGFTALDRSRLKQRLGNAEGVITGLTLDLDATQARVEQLQSYLNLPGSWNVAAATPPLLADPRPADRWSTQPAPAIDTAARNAGTGVRPPDGSSASSPPLQSQD